jgi:predicted Zn finger-like uncharacterized protein
MYTQCPKCLTYFQVTAEHLKVAQGNVRCGQCSNVFSALGNLSEVPPQQNAAQTKSQPNNSSSKVAAEKSTNTAAAVQGTAASNPQSKLTNAIAAIQALNQSSQQILSQGRKNYVSQLQKQAQAQRKPSASNASSSTARELEQEDLEANTPQADQDFDIEEALAAVDGIEVDDDEEDITPPFDASDLVEDYKDRKAATEKTATGKKRAKIIKTNNIQVDDDDVFDFSELDLPDDDVNQTRQSASAKKKNKQAESKQQNKTRKASAARKKSDDKKISNAEAASTKAKAPKPEKIKEIDEQLSGAANEQQINIPQHIVSDPDVIIENNIPTLAIPKALLEDFEQEKLSHVNYRSMLTWGSLSVVMMLVFLGQAIYFKHNELGQISQLRPWIQMFCKHASCELTLQVDIGRIELLGQDIRSHPKSDGALLVSATIINNASFTQPYPGLQLSFSDINGVKVATRNFLPKDYLSSKFSRKKGMESNIPIQLELELVDPGKSAVNFEFDFFSI